MLCRFIYLSLARAISVDQGPWLILIQNLLGNFYFVLISKIFSWAKRDVFFLYVCLLFSLFIHVYDVFEAQCTSKTNLCLNNFQIPRRC